MTEAKTVPPTADPPPGRLRRGRVISVLGAMQILCWGSSYYLSTVLAVPIARDTGWPLSGVVGGLTVGLVVAALAAPRVGRLIDAEGGRRVLSLGVCLLAAGLASLGLAPSLPWYLLGWVLMGLGMAAALYDAAFATLGRLYGLEARSAITLLTLFGGFASTVCWPLSALLLEVFGWRGACFVYALVQLVLVPVLRLGLPAAVAPADAPSRSHDAAEPSLPATAAPRHRLLLLVLLGACLALSATMTTVFSVHLVSLLGARDVALAGAVALGAFIGPAQVGARVLEMLIGRRFHPAWTLLASTLLMAIGLGALALGFPVLALALMFYGSGVGLKSIAGGTVPLALFGPSGYGALVGRLAMPSLLMQAFAPMAAAAFLEAGSAGAVGERADTLLWLLAVLALVNVFIAGGLLVAARRRRGERPG